VEVSKGTPLTGNVIIDKAIAWLSDRLDILTDTPWRRRWQGTQWDDILIPAFALGTGASAPDAVTLVNGLNCQGFDGSGTSEQLYGTFEFLHGWREGSEIHMHVHWVPTTTGTGNVKWQLEYSWANVHEAFPASTTIFVVDSAAGIDNFHKIASFPVVRNANKKIGSVLSFRLFRDPGDAADTYTGDAGLISIGCHIDNDSVGSNELYQKT
jgi:hypothetical protein